MDLSLDTSDQMSVPMIFSYVHLVTFKSCTCTDNGYVQGYVSVQSLSATPTNENSVAISYAIGDFDRQRRVIGHSSNDPQSTVLLDLGAE